MNNYQAEELLKITGEIRDLLREAVKEPHQWPTGEEFKRVYANPKGPQIITLDGGGCSAGDDARDATTFQKLPTHIKITGDGKNSAKGSLWLTNEAAESLAYWLLDMFYKEELI